MSAHWYNDDALVTNVAGHVFDVMAMFPKRLIRVDELIHTFMMPLSHMQILTLVEREDLSIRQLSERTGVAKPNITPLVDALRDRGYVSRRKHENDRRVVCVHLEPAGAEVLSRMRAAVAEQVRAWPKTISRAEIRGLINGLEALRRTMDAMNTPEAR